MCGIFGVVASKSAIDTFSKQLIRDLFVLSESRGKEAAGIALVDADDIHVHKVAMPASKMLKSDVYQQLMTQYFDKLNQGDQPIAVIGHSRLVTNGMQMTHTNNQPVIAAEMIGIHNGIIVNDNSIYSEFPQMNRMTELDSEVILNLLDVFLKDTGDLINATKQTFNVIEGATSTAIAFSQYDSLLLATNNGSLYLLQYKDEPILIFASEEYILKQLSQKSYLLNKFDQPTITRIEPNHGGLVDFSTVTVSEFDFEIDYQTTLANGRNRKISDVKPQKPINANTANDNFSGAVSVSDDVIKRLTINYSGIDDLQRCTRCILPETIPFIAFDDDGVCNFCRQHEPHQVEGKSSLEATIAPHRSKDNSPDCIVMVSGGRDSIYGLHYVREELKLNPIAYTYDWGMVTDLARRNISRICGKLGIEHILVSADINEKRKNIRRNVNAWLKRPRLGTIPLFMAGDKQFFSYARKMREQTGCDLVFMCDTHLEKTGFKTGFTGVSEFNQKDGAWHPYEVSILRKLWMVGYYAKEFILNPSYINASIFDTLNAFYASYIQPHDFVSLYSYIQWDENEIMPVLQGQYDWEVANDTSQTWRIGDGTAAFYNYIYYTMAGFTENDTFLSNMIRENMITRDQALSLVKDRNQPRFESMKWYCDINGIDFELAIRTINSAPRLWNS